MKFSETRQNVRDMTASAQTGKADKATHRLRDLKTSTLAAAMAAIRVTHLTDRIWADFPTFSAPCSVI